MEKFGEILKNKVTLALAALVLFIVVSLSGIAFLASSLAGSDHETSKAKISTSTSTTKPKSTTTTIESTTTTSSTSSTTTTTKPQGEVAAVDSTTTTVPAFAITPTATFTGENIVHCVSATFNFAGTVHANGLGSATYEWIRSDGIATNATGNVTFNSAGVATSSIDSYSLETYYASQIDGWVALKVTWNGGTATSTHATYNYTYGTGASIPTGC
jgi:hypothetical protein